MTSFSTDTIQQAMRVSGMIPVFYHAEVEVAKAVLDASYKGGVRVFEFTNRGENAFQVFTQLLKHAQQYPDLMMGIGTLMNAEVTQKFCDAGAHFIVSPILKAEMATVCHQQNKLAKKTDGNCAVLPILSVFQNVFSIQTLFVSIENLSKRLF